MFAEPSCTRSSQSSHTCSNTSWGGDVNFELIVLVKLFGLGLYFGVNGLISHYMWPSSESVCLFMDAYFDNLNASV